LARLRVRIVTNAARIALALCSGAVGITLRTSRLQRTRMMPLGCHRREAHGEQDTTKMHLDSKGIKKKQRLTLANNDPATIRVQIVIEYLFREMFI
jgi:hypothetical protein